MARVNVWIVDPVVQAVSKQPLIENRVMQRTDREQEEEEGQDIMDMIRDVEKRLAELTAQRAGVSMDVLRTVAHCVADGVPSNMRAHCLGEARSGSFVVFSGVWCVPLSVASPCNPWRTPV